MEPRALPEPERSREERSKLVRPRTPVEELLAGIWGEVLSVEEVGVGENFFELGGHSLLATRVISRVRESFAIELSLRNLFERPTIEGLSEVVEGKLKAGQASRQAHA